jgi:hypothetical protein
MVAVLVKAFPDREADGVRKMVLIQASKNCSSKERDEKRGLISLKPDAIGRRRFWSQLN